MVTGNLFTTKLLKIQWLRLYVFNKKILTISLLLVILIWNTYKLESGTYKLLEIDAIHKYTIRQCFLLSDWLHVWILAIHIVQFVLLY